MRGYVRRSELRDHASQLEKFDIIFGYHRAVTGDLHQAIDVGKLYSQTYPKSGGHNDLGICYGAMGQFEKAIEEYRKQIQFNPGWIPYANIAFAQIRLNGFDEAEKTARQALSLGYGEANALHQYLFQLAAIRGDTTKMQEQLDWLKGRPNDYLSLTWQAEAAAFSGQLKEAEKQWTQAAYISKQRNQPSAASGYLDAIALRYALAGDCGRARSQTFSVSLLCGSLDEAQAIADKALSEQPQGTVASQITYPIRQAEIAERRGDYQKAIALTASVVAGYERAGGFELWSVRGRAYLGVGDGTAAAVEFQKIIDHRGQEVFSIRYPLAYLWLGRAWKMAGDLDKSRKAYGDFFNLWKDADPDLPVLIKAKAEYEILTAKRPH